MQRLTEVDQERFERFYVPISETGCWIWIGGAGRYGLFYSTRCSSKGKKSEQAHRISYELRNGQIPEGKVVMHSCDITYCVNPEHLSLGTQRDNMKDCVAKGRQVHKRKITEEMLLEMRKRRKAGVSVKTLADDYNINRGHCSRLVRGAQPKGKIKCQG